MIFSPITELVGLDLIIKTPHKSICIRRTEYYVYSYSYLEQLNNLPQDYRLLTDEEFELLNQFNYALQNFKKVNDHWVLINSHGEFNINNLTWTFPIRLAKI